MCVCVFIIKYTFKFKKMYLDVLSNCRSRPSNFGRSRCSGFGRQVHGFNERPRGRQEPLNNCGNYFVFFGINKNFNKIKTLDQI